MGVLLSNTYRVYWKSPDTAPDLFSDPTFSHDYGFSGERKQRSTYLTGRTKCRQIPTTCRQIVPKLSRPLAAATAAWLQISANRH